ncbi:hypothetical protein CAC42_5245 [Sphaceloma murrayae]|uniref:Coupling of ubiquitin conjugation to ER degradation protein 1 n=1 Tax=Sphaceloma murrayae TaxID=2082308 RepID=A0A2K1QUG4_9PEZI|nr:hypothetical protein CAC42_5245 [Sphaceloma murrayae]
MAEQTLNLPQIIAVVLIGFFAIRWFLSSSGSQSGGSRAGRQVNPTHVEQIFQMFPQLDRRAIAWDLQQNGGSVQATTERVLGGRALAQPPPSFQPQLPASTTPAASSTRQPTVKAPLPDLISKYNLSSKVKASDGEQSTAEQVGKDAKNQPGWSQNKVERSELFRRRREEMILAARRKLEAKERQASVGTTQSLRSMPGNFFGSQPTNPRTQPMANHRIPNGKLGGATGWGAGMPLGGTPGFSNPPSRANTMPNFAQAIGGGAPAQSSLDMSYVKSTSLEQQELD